jgi:UDPglucose--hexose-1-phosphate uridylyltransferase
MNALNRWEQRWHPLREEWVVVAAHRQDRPWLGETIGAAHGPENPLPDYAPGCYFCPGNPRVSGAKNENYEGIYVFDNDHPCVGSEAPQPLEPPSGIFKNSPATGIARVLCYSPRHNATLAELETSEIEKLVEAWRQQYAELGARQDVQHVLIFENKGEVVGVSNPHPHCQIYATNFLFKTIETEARVCRQYHAETGRILFQDILQSERQDCRRIVYENASAIVFMPYFARYAYECYVAPRKTHPGLGSLNSAEVRDLADALKNLLVRYDNLWRMPFPYVMTLHHAPVHAMDETFHFHIEFHPPLRKPQLLKYLAGPEIGGGNFLSDTLPEEKAAELRNAGNVHYKRDHD